MCFFMGRRMNCNRGIDDEIRIYDENRFLKSRVETRMKITVMTSTGDDDLINPEEKGDLEYRKAQLKRLQEEVVDIEDMSDGISIMDLGLNEFRLDLLDYILECTYCQGRSAPNRSPRGNLRAS